MYHQARPASNQGRLESCHYTQNVVDRQNPVHLASIPHHRIDPCFNHPNWLSQFLLFLLQILNHLLSNSTTTPRIAAFFLAPCFLSFLLVEIHLSYSQQPGEGFTTDDWLAIPQAIRWKMWIPISEVAKSPSGFTAERRKNNCWNSRKMRKYVGRCFFWWAKGAGSRKIYYRLTKGLFFKGVVQEGMSQYYNPEK